MSREQERSRLEERITVAEQKEKRYADQMKILTEKKRILTGKSETTDCLRGVQCWNRL